MCKVRAVGNRGYVRVFDAKWGDGMARFDRASRGREANAVMVTEGYPSAGRRVWVMVDVV